MPRPSGADEQRHPERYGALLQARSVRGIAARECHRQDRRSRSRTKGERSRRRRQGGVPGPWRRKTQYVPHAAPAGETGRDRRNRSRGPGASRGERHRCDGGGLKVVPPRAGTLRLQPSYRLRRSLPYKCANDQIVMAACLRPRIICRIVFLWTAGSARRVEGSGSGSPTGSPHRGTLPSRGRAPCAWRRSSRRGR